jgi:uncharacterized protein YjbI with pentapeptide repeats
MTKTMDTKVIGAKISLARKKMSMSQAQLAQLLFISPQAVGKWERGESVPDITTINRVAEILGVDLNYFSENAQPAEHEQSVKATSENIGAAEPTEQNITGHSSSPGRQLLTNFSGSNLPDSDFADVIAHKRKFNGSALRLSNFKNADFTGSSFSGSDMHAANFDRTNLTDCTFSANTLTQASFNKSILIRTEFSASALDGAQFINIELIDVKLIKTDLRNTIFKDCVFTGVDFKYSDLRGLQLDGNTFIDVKFQKAALNDATFNNAILKNVSFLPAYALTNKYYKAIQTIRFDGATMDKLTYASLKGVGADLSKVTTI